MKLRERCEARCRATSAASAVSPKSGERLAQASELDFHLILAIPHVRGGQVYASVRNRSTVMIPQEPLRSTPFQVLSMHLVSRRRFLESSLALSLIGITTPAWAGFEQTDQDVVAAFKKYIADYMASYGSDKRELVAHLGGGWVNEQFQPAGEPSIDVRRTDSLISPFAGTCEFTLVRSRTDFHSSESDAKSDGSFDHTDSTKHRHSYAYQDGHWVPVSREHFFPSLNKWYDCDECNTTSGAPLGDIDGCWEPGAMHHLKPCE